MDVYSENGLLWNLALGFGIVWMSGWMSGGLCLLLPTAVALRSYCICGSTCDMAVTSLTYPSALSFLMAVPGLCELMLNQCLLRSWIKC